jgi:parvulin-like peptidyl-prolyl isomerase
MKYKLSVCILLVTSLTSAAQVASHARSAVVAPPAATPVAASVPPAQVQISDRPVARVNGAVLTDRDLIREMYAIFPYAKQHNGFPKAQEASIRQGALEMIIFEELVYQEAGRRKLTISPARLNTAEAEFRKQFHSPDEYAQYLAAEMGGSHDLLRKQMRRSMLIEEVLKADVDNKSAVTLAEVRAYYDKNPARFQTPESFSIQSISILPPRNAKDDVEKTARKRAEDALQQAKAAKNYQEFGLLAEKLSEDDFRVNMGDHKAVGREKLPPQVVKTLVAMQPGQVTGVIQIENAFTIIRLNAHTPVRKQNFAEVKADLKTELQKSKYERLRSNLAKKLRAQAKIEIV